MNTFLKAHLPWILMMIAIAIQSSISGIRIPDVGFRFMDKLLHFLVFGLLGVMLIRGFSIKPITMEKYSVFVVILVGIIFAATDEWHQTFVPGRTGDIWDWVADTLGIIFFVLLYIVIRKKLFQKKALKNSHHRTVV